MSSCTKELEIAHLSIRCATTLLTKRAQHQKAKDSIIRHDESRHDW